MSNEKSEEDSDVQYRVVDADGLEHSLQSNKSPQSDKNAYKYPNRIPKETEAISVEVPEKVLEAIGEKSESAGVEQRSMIREGIKKLMTKAFDSPADVRTFVRSTVGEDSPDEEEVDREDVETIRQEIDIEVNPNEQMYLRDALELINDPEESEGYPNISKKDFLKGGVQWAVENLEVDDIDTEKDDGRGASSRRFEKFPGQDRGGKVVNLAITQDGKKLLDERAKEFHKAIKTSQFTRECVRRMYEWVLEEPEEALDFILEEQEYYQPPRGLNDYQYGYQVRLKIVDKRRVKRAHGLLNDRFGGRLGRHFKQREFLQGVARYGIERFRIEDSDIPIV